MKNYLLTFVLALLVVLTGMTVRRAVAGIGGSPVPLPPNVTGIGGSPVPLPPNVTGIGGSPVPLPPNVTTANHAR
jgi:hypothetical protein